MSDGQHGKYALALSDDEIQRYRFMAQAAREREAHWWQLAGIAEGACVLDLGCGPGLVALEMAQVVGAGGRVVGVDREAMVDAGIATADDVERWDRALTEDLDNVVNTFIAAHVIIGKTPDH
jgi:ubiquinone/menaquinone biosynthesis C-methylase UbiE